MIILQICSTISDKKESSVGFSLFIFKHNPITLLSFPQNIGVPSWPRPHKGVRDSV